VVGHLAEALPHLTCGPEGGSSVAKERWLRIDVRRRG